MVPKPNTLLTSRGSARLIFAAVLLGACLVISASPVNLRGQASKPAVRPEDFAGTWRAQYKDKTFAILRLKQDGDELAGWFAAGDISANDDGDVIEVSAEANGEQAIQQPKLADGKLTFQTKDEDGPLNYEFTLVDATHGRLKILVPEGGPKLNPFAMTKDSAKP